MSNLLWFKGFLVGAFMLLCLEKTYAAITINNITTTVSTCGNNGTATISAVSTKSDPFLIYEIVGGPATAPLQNNPTFSSLFPGTYTVRVYDIDFVYKEQQFTIGGNYQLPDFTPIAVNPLCPGHTDGKVIGNPNVTKGKAPFTWEMLAPVSTGPQSSDVFDHLSSGSYTIKMTDDCGNFQTRTSILVEGGTGLSHWYDGLPSITKIGCDKVSLAMQIKLNNSKSTLPLKLTINTIAGAVTKHVRAYPLDTVNYVPGLYEIRDTVDNITYGDYLGACITDTCGVTICGTAARVAPFDFYLRYKMTEKCGNKMAADIFLKNPPDIHGYMYTYYIAPIRMTLTDVATNQLVDSMTCDMSYCSLSIKEQVSGRTYQLKIIDGCGKVFQQNIVWPVPAAPRVDVSAGQGCMDSTAVGYFNIMNFKSNTTLEILSGPTHAGSTKRHYEFSDNITYPKSYSKDINGYAIKNLAQGVYTYRVSDTCGNVVTGTFEIQAVHLADFHYTYSVRKGCLGDNILYFDASSQNTAGVYVRNAGTGEILYQRRGLVTPDSLTSLVPGKYELQIFYGYIPNVGGAVYDAAITDSNQDCWAVTDVIDIPPYSNNTFKANNTILCNGTSYVEIKVDSTRGVPPYQFEISSGPQTFPLQNSNVFQIPTYGNYVIRIKDACGNSNTRQISVDSAKFPPVVKKGASCAGNRVVLKGVSSSFFKYEWQRPNGSIYQGDSIVINPLSPADTGLYIITKKVTINGCTDSFQSSYRLYLHDVHEQTIRFCRGTPVHVGSHVYTVPGIYRDTLQNMIGCDSIVITNLRTFPQKIDTNRVTICKGSQITVGSNHYSLPGVYKDSVQNVLGCYDLTVTMLKVNGIPDTVQATTCAGSSVTVGSHTYNQTGVYTDTLHSSLGCDSIVITKLVINPYKEYPLAKAICAGQSFTLGNAVYTKTGIYRDTIGASPCPVIIVLSLTVDYKKDSVNRTICEGQRFSLGGKTYTITGIYRDTIPTLTCDSIITVNLNVLPYKRSTIARSICEGTSITIGRHTYKTAGVYNDTLSTTGCDSIVTVNLSILPYKRSTVTRTICAGGSVIIGQHTYKTTGVYSDTLSNEGCDSIVTLNLSVLPYKRSTIARSICKGESITIGNTTYTVGGVYADTIPTLTCDSIVTIKVEVYTEPTEAIFAQNTLGHCFDDGPLTLTAFWGKSFLWTNSGETSQSIQVNAIGVYQVKIQDVNGCPVVGEVTVEDRCETKLFVPSAFSPNGDGNNDDLEVFGKNFTNFKIMIFNRWGEVIFISTDRNIRWDGSYRGEEMPIGTYPWTIQYQSVFDTEGSEQTMKGSVTLIR